MLRELSEQGKVKGKGEGKGDRVRTTRAMFASERRQPAGWPTDLGRKKARPVEGQLLIMTIAGPLQRATGREFVAWDIENQPKYSDSI